MIIMKREEKKEKEKNKKNEIYKELYIVFIMYKYL